LVPEEVEQDNVYDVDEEAATAVEEEKVLEEEASKEDEHQHEHFKVTC
jgi:hypothetical protein